MEEQPEPRRRRRPLTTGQLVALHQKSLAMAASCARRSREVLLFGLSANPPTSRAGHMGMVAHCRPHFDEIWLLPVYQHIFSSKQKLAPFDQRLEMCRLAIAALPVASGGAQVKVVEEERKLYEHLESQSKRSGVEMTRPGSIDLVLFLREKYPDTSFSMVLGADTYADLVAGKWKRGDKLLQLVKLLVVDRKGVDSPWRQQDAADVDERVSFIHVPELNDMSSTMMRATTDREVLARHLDDAVVDYIVEHQLYAFAETSEAHE